MSSSHVAPVGLCLTMCPELEVRMRDDAHLVHPLEEEKKKTTTEQQPSSPPPLRHEKDYPCSPPAARQGSRGSSSLASHAATIGSFPVINKHRRRGDRRRMVKAYRRPAAGRNEDDPFSLRPFPVLQKTVKYLTQNVAKDASYEWDLVYDFVSDRLRAVRQDMIIQCLPSHGVFSLLSEMVEFYLVATYRCETEECASYDGKLHFSQFDEVMSRLREASSQETETGNTLLMRQVDLLYRAEETRIWEDYFAWRSHSHCSEDKYWKLCAQVIASIKSINFIRFFRSVKQLPRILRLAACLHVGKVRRKAFDVMAKAFKSKNFSFSLSVLYEWLMFDSEEDAFKCAVSCGFHISENESVVPKKSFKEFSSNDADLYWNRCDRLIDV